MLLVIHLENLQNGLYSLSHVFKASAERNAFKLPPVTHINIYDWPICFIELVVSLIFNFVF